MKPILKNKAKTVNRLGKVDTETIDELILKIPEKIWQMETKNRDNDFSCFTQTQHIIFKFNLNTVEHKSFSNRPLWKIWQPILLPIMEQAVAPYGYKNGIIPKAMLARLSAGGEIDEHIDAGPRNRQIHKIHIPIQTAPEVLFYVDTESYHLAKGYAYEVNNIVKHKAINNSKEARIHLIFEYFDGDL